MKTIKIKVKLLAEQAQSCDRYLEELTWLWNQVLANQLHNHCITWYNWAGKLSADLAKATEKLEKLKPEQQQLVRNYYRSKDKPKLNKKEQELVAKFDIFSRWLPFDLENIIPVPLRVGNSGYEGLSCQIATGGSYWKRDDNFNIPIKTKKGIIHVKGSKLVKGDYPWKRIQIMPHQYKTFPSGKFEGRELIDLMKFDNLNGLNGLRAMQNLPDLSVSSHYVGGLLEFFKQSWLAFLDPKRINSRKPKFKKDADKISTLFNKQCPPNKIDIKNNSVEVTGFGNLIVTDRSWGERLNLDSSLPRTYMLTKKASGYYINIVLAHPLQEEKAVLTKKLPKVKKELGEDSQEYEDIKSKIKFIEQQIKDSLTVVGKNLSVGIDPGVQAIVATDHGALFLPNLSRERVSIHIEELQSRLDNLELINDKKWKDSGSKGARPKTKNEIKIQDKITRLHERGANSSNAFNHKMSTRLSRTYEHIAWEDTQLTNLLKQTEAKALPEGVGYAHNGASAKRGLNWIMRQRCLGDLKAKTKQKVEARGGSFHEPPANYSSQLCHCCHQKGERLSQYEFVCKNLECELLNTSQQADTNAARNHKHNSNFELGEVKYHNTRLFYQKPKRFKKKRLTK
jgi:transposase